MAVILNYNVKSTFDKNPLPRLNVKKSYQYNDPHYKQ